MAGKIGDDGLTREERKAKLERERQVGMTARFAKSVLSGMEERSQAGLRDAGIILDMLKKSMDEEVQAYTVYEQRADEIRQMTTIPHLRKQALELLKELIADENDHFRKLKALAQLIEGG